MSKTRGIGNMEYIRGESREQIILLPDCVDDYITENNSVRVIEAYVNSLDLAGQVYMGKSCRR